MTRRLRLAFALAALVVLGVMGTVCGGDGRGRVLALEADITGLRSVAAAPDGSRVYLGLFGLVWALDPATGSMEHVMGGGDVQAADPRGSNPFDMSLPFLWPSAMVVAEDGSLLVSRGYHVMRLADGLVYPVLDGWTDEERTDGPASEINAGYVETLALAPDGGIYFTSSPYEGRAAEELKHLSPDGEVRTIVRQAEVVAGESIPVAILDVAETADGRVYYAAPRERLYEVVAGTARLVADLAGTVNAWELGDRTVPIDQIYSCWWPVGGVQLDALEDELLIWHCTGVLAVDAAGDAYATVGGGEYGVRLAPEMDAADFVRRNALDIFKAQTMAADGTMWVATSQYFDTAGPRGFLYRINPGSDTAVVVAGRFPVDG